jgi:hypothetical protein
MIARSCPLEGYWSDVRDAPRAHLSDAAIFLFLGAIRLEYSQAAMVEKSSWFGVPVGFFAWKNNPSQGRGRLSPLSSPHRCRSLSTVLCEEYRPVLLQKTGVWSVGGVGRYMQHPSTLSVHRLKLGRNFCQCDD